jgi:hypothetical protein
MKRVHKIVAMFKKMDVAGKGYLVEEDQRQQYRDKGANMKIPKVEAYRIKQWKKLSHGRHTISLQEFGAGYGLEPAHFREYEAAQGNSACIGTSSMSVR